MKNNYVILAGLLGLLASILVGIGEHLLHGVVDIGGEQGAPPYSFMLHLSQKRLAWGHFLTVLSAPFWLIGYWHVYKMLTPKGFFWFPAAICLIACYGFIVGTVWIGSRAMIASIIQTQEMFPVSESIDVLVDRYSFLMESLLTVIRVTTLAFSAGFVYLVLSRETYYPKWMACFNPFLILVLEFATYYVIPPLANYIIPIAMNIAQGLFFAASLYCALKSRQHDSV